MRETRTYIERHGRPIAFYSDKHAIFRINKPDAEGGSGMTQFGRALHEINIDILCANAGVSTMRRAVDLTDEDWDFNFDVNARGVFLSNQIACRYFLAEKKKGVIVNTASLAAKMGAPLLAHYSASKFAVFGWTQALAREMAPHGIRVNAVCPGFVHTSMQEREIVWEGALRGMTPEAVRAEYVSLTPMGRIPGPAEMAGPALFLATDDAAHITGGYMVADGGYNMVGA